MKQVCLKYYEVPHACKQFPENQCSNCPEDAFVKEYNYLNERYAKDRTKVDVISGMVMVQAMCSRMLIEGHDSKILELMGNIATAIENIKDSDD
jgi:hypothetical protein